MVSKGICANMFGATEAARQSLEYTEGLLFTGLTKPANPKTGDIFLDPSTQNFWLYNNSEWVEIIRASGTNTGDQTIQRRLVTSPLVKSGRCSCCGGQDSGAMKCRYCKTTLRWYE